MIRDITLGQYYPGQSVLHKLDPRVKLLGTIVFIVSLFLFQSFLCYVVATVFLVSIIVISKVPFSFMVKGLKAIIILLFLTVLLNMFFTPGEVLVSFHGIQITKEGVKMAAFMMIRLIYLIIGSSIMTLTTTPSNLTDGMEKGLSFLKVFKVPVHEIAMMMSIALSFIPILLEETDKIMKAQMARGASFDEGKLSSRVKSLVPLLVPLFVSAFKRANDLAMAMEARCYQGGKGRTKMKPLVYKRRDFCAYGILLLYLAAIIFVGIL